MAEEKKSASKQKKRQSTAKKDATEIDAKKTTPEEKPMQKDEYQALRERLLRDYKGRLTADQIEQRISVIKKSEENN